MRLSRARLLEVLRYYQAGIVNTAFGLLVYAGLVRVGLNMYVSQLLAHLIGMAFNYISYSHHVFRDAGPAKLRFVLSYAANYLVSLTTLACVARLIASPYLAGFVTAGLVSVLNYVVLRRLVFRVRPA